MEREKCHTVRPFTVPLVYLLWFKLEKSAYLGGVYAMLYDYVTVVSIIVAWP